LQGLLTINGTNEYTSPNRITTALAADTMAAILADIASSIGQTTNGVEQPDTIITTLRVRDAAMHTRRAIGGKSVYEEFMDTERAAGRITRWVVDEHLKGAAPDGTDIAIVLHYNPDKVKLKIVQDFTMLDEQQRGYGYTVHAFASTALVLCMAPQSIMKCYNV
jgi:hypothetical protein